MHFVATIVVMLLGAVEFVRSAPLDLDLEGVDKADAMMVRFLEWFKQAAESAKLNKDCEYIWAHCICALFAISDDIFCALFAISIAHYFHTPIRTN